MKIALVANRWPWPPRRGDQLRAAQLASLLDDKFELTVLAPLPRGAEVPRASATSAELIPFEMTAGDRISGLLAAALTGRPLQSGLQRSGRLAELLDTAAPDLVIIQLVRTGTWLAERLQGVPMIIDLIDSLSLNFERRSRFDSSWKRPFLRLEAERLARAEEDLIARSRAAVVVAQRDRDFITRRLPGVLEKKLAVIPLAVETPAPPPSILASGRQQARFILTGSLGYFPTAEGLEWWLREIWPRVRERIPAARLNVAGSRPSLRLSSAVERAGAELIADPASFDEIFNGATASLVPLRAGSGLPIKILEAWRAGVPVVATSWAAEGVRGRSGSDMLVAEDPDSWVAALVALASDRALGERLAFEGRSRLQREFSAEAVGRAWSELIESALAQSGMLTPRP